MMDLSFTYSTFYACTDEPETGLRYSTGEADICINMYTCTYMYVYTNPSRATMIIKSSLANRHR